MRSGSCPFSPLQYLAMVAYSQFLFGRALYERFALKGSKLSRSAAGAGGQILSLVR